MSNLDDDRKTAGLPLNPSVTPEGSQGTGSRGVPWWPGHWIFEVEAEPDGFEVAVYISAEHPEFVALMTCANTDSITEEDWKRAKNSVRLASFSPQLYDALADVAEMFRAFPLLRNANAAKVNAIEWLLAKARGEDAPTIQSPTPQQEPKKGTQGGQ